MGGAKAPVKLPFVSVKDYGAKGDGVTDDTTALDAALAAVGAAGGGIVYFPAGSYVWGGVKNTNPPDNITLEGAGMFSSTIILKAGINTGVKLHGAISNLTIRDIAVDNGAYLPTTNGMLVMASENSENLTFERVRWICRGRPFRISTCDGLTVHGCRFENHPVYPGMPVCDAETGPSNVVVTDNYFEAATLSTAAGNCFCSINLQPNDAVVANNVIGGSYVGGILIETAVDKVVVANNVIDLSGMVEAWAVGVDIQQVGTFEVVGNHITGIPHASSAGVAVQAASAVGSKQPNGLIASNLLVNTGTGISIDEQGGAGTHLPSVAVIGNRLSKINNGKAFYVQAANAGAENVGPVVEIMGNSVVDSTCGGTSRFIQACIHSATGGRLVITGNSFEPAAGYGMVDCIDLIGASNTTVPTVVGNNACADVTKAIYRIYNLKNAFTAAEFAKIVFLNSRVIGSTPIDLSGAAVTQKLYGIAGGTLGRIPVRVSFIYSEGSSADAGVEIDVDAVGSAVRNLVHSVTESGKALNYRKDFYLPDMGSGNGSWAGADNMLQVSTAGGKTGAGEVAVVVEYVVNAGCA